MSTSADLREIFTAGRPLVEQWLDVGEQIAALRDTATSKGLDWSQVKALLKAQIQDERDEAPNGRRVKRIVEKAEFASAYADMLGLARMNEIKFSAGEEFDRETGEIVETQEQFDAGVEEMRRRAARFLRIEIDRETGEILESHAAEEPPTLLGDGTTEPDRRSGDEDGQSNSTVQMQEGDVEGEGQAGVAREHGSGEPSQPLLPSDRVDETPDAPAVIAGAPIPTPAAGGNTAEPDSGSGNTSLRPGVAADRTGGASASPAPGVVTYERCPPNPVHWHDYAKCFPEMFGLALLSLSKDIERNGVRKPIVKIGDAVLDGRSRYNMARQLVGEGLIESYPVVEYAGDDALRDVVRWNLESGRLLTMAERKVIATKLSKLPGNEHRGSEIDQLLGLGAVETGRAA